MISILKKIRHYGILKSISLVIPSILRNIYLKKRAKLFKQNAKTVLADVTRIFQDNNIIYWVEYGTLLGIVRDGELIPHDLDIDLGVYSPTDPDLYKDVLIRNGFCRLKVWLINGKVIEETYIYKGVHLDLYYFEADGNNLFTYTCYRKRTIDSSLKDDEYHVIKYSYSGYSGFHLYDFDSIQVMIPENHDMLLQQKYGNWRVKDPSWTIFDSPAVQKISDLATLKRENGCASYQ